MSASTQLVVWSLVLAIGLVSLGRYRGGLATTGIAFPNWDFSKSWASNLTALGGILGTVLSAKVLPAQPVVMPSDGYIALSLFFGLLVVVAPFVYVAFQQERPATGGPRFTGSNGAFLVASAVTVWAVTGQIGTVGLIFYEAQHAKALTPGAVIPILSTLGVALLLACRYSVRSVELVLESERATKASARKPSEARPARKKPVGTAEPEYQIFEDEQMLKTPPTPTAPASWTLM